METSTMSQRKPSTSSKLRERRAMRLARQLERETLRREAEMRPLRRSELVKEAR